MITIPATNGQIELIEELQLLGAPIPPDEHDNPSGGMFESFENAEKYIDQNIGYLSLKPTTDLGMDEWGGIPNC